MKDREDLEENFLIVKFNEEIKKKYPRVIPTMYIENEEIPGLSKLEINKAIIEESINYLGTQMIYPVATWFQENSTDLVNKFFPKIIKKEKKPKYQNKPSFKKTPNPQPKRIPTPQPCWNCGDLG